MVLCCLRCRLKKWSCHNLGLVSLSNPFLVTDCMLKFGMQMAPVGGRGQRGAEEGGGRARGEESKNGTRNS